MLWTRSQSLGETTQGGDTELVWGEAELPERLGELELRISPEAFLQTNTEMAERLYGVVSEYAALSGWERVYDLYCGIGTIALTLAPRAGELWGIELIEQAVADATRRPANGVSNASFFAGDARTALPELAPGRASRRAGGRPPRAGLSRKVVARIAEASPRRIVYVSCNPTTLAPNAAELREAGWTLTGAPGGHVPQTPTSSAWRCWTAPAGGGAGAARRTGRVPFRRCAPPPSERQQIVIEEHPDPVPAAGEVLVRVHAAGLNGADMMQRRGLYPAPPGSPQDIPGMELAGEVEALGHGVRSASARERG